LSLAQLDQVVRIQTSTYRTSVHSTTKQKIAGVNFARLSSSIAACGTLAALAVVGIAATVINLNKSSRKSLLKTIPEAVPMSTLKSNSTTSRDLLRRKPWPNSAAIALSTHSRIQRGCNLIEWYKDGSAVEQDIPLRGMKEHSVAVVNHLDQQFYLRLPRSLSAPCQLDLDASPRRVEQARDILTIADLEKALRCQLELCTPRAYQLFLTNTPEATVSVMRKKEVVVLVINKPVTGCRLPYDYRKKHVNYLLVIARSMFGRLFRESIVDNVASLHVVKYQTLR
jgi:hypothetical protein